MFTPVPVGGTIEIFSGNGQSGVVCVEVPRVDARLRRDGADRLHLEPQRRQRGR
jgi:hypothetical protein